MAFGSGARDDDIRVAQVMKCIIGLLGRRKYDGYIAI